MNGDTRDVRPGEELDWKALAGYLRRSLPDDVLPSVNRMLPMHVAQFPGGHSNLTYLIRFGDTEMVVRRPPLGPVPPRAHDVAREFRWLESLHPVFPLAPRPFLLCEDADVVGSVFYAMERRHGLVIRREEPSTFAAHPERRRTVSAQLIDALAALHELDIRSLPLAGLGKPSGFVERQIRGWTDRWHGARTTELAEMDELASWLIGHAPGDPPRPAVVHGDFKLDNVLLDTLTASRIVAVFDWEMSALGDPLVDLGILLAYWVPTAPPDQADALTTVTDRPGWFSREELIEQYARRSGHDVSGIRFFEIFALFKIAVVIQQIFARYARGQTDDPRFAAFDRRVAYLARQAQGLAMS